MRKIKNFLYDIFSDEDLIQLGKDCLQILLFFVGSIAIIMAVAFAYEHVNIILNSIILSINISKWVVIILLVILLLIALFPIIVYLYSCLKSLFRKS